MITYEQLKTVNEHIKVVDIKGKNYAQVNDRINAFRELCPNGSIETDIISLENGVVTMKAVVKDEAGNILGTGLAQEKEQSSYINKTSFIENCETSAVGRALGMCGIGCTDAICSAEERQNEIVNSEKPFLPTEDGIVTDEMKERLKYELKRVGATEKELLKLYEVKELNELSQVQVITCINALTEKKDNEGLKSKK